jgi:hypothetical protein
MLSPLNGTLQLRGDMLLVLWEGVEYAHLPTHGSSIVIPCVVQVSPAPRQVRHNAADGSLVATGTANTICLQLAGGWLPLQDVSGADVCATPCVTTPSRCQHTTFWLTALAVMLQSAKAVHWARFAAD